MSLYDEIEAAMERCLECDRVLDDTIRYIIHEIVEPRAAAAHKQGYSMGEMERDALATANSDLRSELLALQQEYGYPPAG